MATNEREHKEDAGASAVEDTGAQSDPIVMPDANLDLRQNGPDRRQLGFQRIRRPNLDEDTGAQSDPIVMPDANLDRQQNGPDRRQVVSQRFKRPNLYEDTGAQSAPIVRSDTNTNRDKHLSPKDKSASRSAKDKVSTARLSGERLVGSRVKVWWPLDSQFYKGNVVSYISSEKKHKVLYDDDEEETLDMRKERWDLIEEDYDGTPSADKKFPKQNGPDHRQFGLQRIRRPNLDEDTGAQSAPIVRYRDKLSSAKDKSASRSANDKVFNKSSQRLERPNPATQSAPIVRPDIWSPADDKIARRLAEKNYLHQANIYFQNANLDRQQNGPDSRQVVSQRFKRPNLYEDTGAQSAPIVRSDTNTNRDKHLSPKDKSASRSAKDKVSTARLSGERLVGSRVKVWWPLDSQFYKGNVVSYISSEKKHKVLYDDDEEETLDMSKERWDLIEEDYDGTPSADKKFPKQNGPDHRQFGLQRIRRPNLDEDTGAQSASRSANDKVFNKSSQRLKRPNPATQSAPIVRPDIWSPVDDKIARRLAEKNYLHQANIYFQNANLDRQQNGPDSRQVVSQRFKRPNLYDWFKKILNIGYSEIVSLDQQTLNKCGDLPLRFNSSEQYIESLEPFVLEEFKAQLKSSSMKQRNVGVLSVLSVRNTDGFPVVQLEDENVKGLSVYDLVLFTEQLTEKRNISVKMLGMVESRQWDQNTKSSKLSVLFHLPDHSEEARRNLVEHTKLHATLLLNMTSQIREFHSIACIKDIPILPAILKPTSHHSFDPDTRRSALPYLLRQKLESSYNRSQLLAISSAIGSAATDITLIQGPPGTGKTRTIVAVVSALLALVPDGIGRILICAQSNAAVDELVVRVSRIYGKTGEMFQPYLVRLGKAVHKNAERFLLDTLVDQQSEERGIANKALLRRMIITEAKIVASTLSGCGGELHRVCTATNSESALFDAIIIDEAAQALELASLIPLHLMKRGAKCIMVGDPRQLPATVLSRTAGMSLFARSMFERLQSAGHPVAMLMEQYRMHPEISRFPSKQFYDDMLINGTANKVAPFHTVSYFAPYLFYDVHGQEQQNMNNRSLYNVEEAEFAVALLSFYKKRFPAEFVAREIGIITPYKEQLSMLNSRFCCAFGEEEAGDMQLNTVDAFQGKEVDILVLSTVRASDEKGIGFVEDERRMNVALTRAKRALWIVGDKRTLQRDPNWEALVKDAMERKLIIHAKRPYNSMFGEEETEQTPLEKPPHKRPRVT